MIVVRFINYGCPWQSREVKYRHKSLSRILDNDKTYEQDRTIIHEQAKKTNSLGISF